VAIKIRTWRKEKSLLDARMFEIDQRTNPTPWLRKVAPGGKPKWPLVADCVEKVLAAVGSQFFKGR
jgi:hypothetical protein